MKRKDVKTVLLAIVGLIGIIAAMYTIVSVCAVAAGWIGYGRGAIQTISGAAVTLVCLLFVEEA